MATQQRAVKVWAALVGCMTIGALLLMALGNNIPSAGSFSLSVYSKLSPINKTLRSKTPQMSDRFNSIEVFYSGTKAGDLDQIASLEGLENVDQLNFHFLVCNNLGTPDGQILSTERWQKQWACTPSSDWLGSSNTIRICVVGDGNDFGSDCQRKRLISLIEGLCRKYQILPESISLPGYLR